MAEIPMTRRRFMVLGRCYTKSDRLAWAIQEITEDPQADKLPKVPDFGAESVKLFKKLRLVRAGTIITLEMSEDGRTVVPTSAQFEKNLPQEIATGWQIADKANVDHDTLRRTMKRQAGRDLPFEVLEPWRRLISRTFGLQRIVLIARLLNYVERGEK